MAWISEHLPCVAARQRPPRRPASRTLAAASFAPAARWRFRGADPRTSSAGPLVQAATRRHCSTPTACAPMACRACPIRSPGSGFSPTAVPVGSGIDPRSPAYRTAALACAHLYRSTGPRPGETASQKRADLRYAQCMRAHGVARYPDPTYYKGSKTEKPWSFYGINDQSPAFRSAEKACESV